MIGTSRKTVLITGITGFVGAYLTRKLVHEGHEVVGLYRRRSDGFKPILLKKFSLLDDTRLVEGDITDLTSLLNAVQEFEPDWIFHLAAQSFVPQSFREPLGTFNVNCLGIHNILEAVRLRRPESKLIFAGSCYDVDTKAVTTRGILSYNELQIGDQVYTINTESNQLELLPIEEIIINHYEGDMLKFVGKRVDLCVTPNHRMYHYGNETWKNHDLIIEDAEQLYNRDYKCKLMRPSITIADNENTIDISPLLADMKHEMKWNAYRIPRILNLDLFLYILGVYIGDGFIAQSTKQIPSKTGLSHEQYITIGRNNKGRFISTGIMGPTKAIITHRTAVNLCVPSTHRSRSKIENALTELGLKYGIDGDDIRLESTELAHIMNKLGHVHDKHIPAWVWKYSADHLQYLFDGLLDSDGSHLSFTTVSKALVRDMVELSYRIGLVPTYNHRIRPTFYRPSTAGLNRTVSQYDFSFSRFTATIRPKQKVYYNGIVWCIKVKNHNFLVTRNGKSCWSGNSEEYGLQFVDETHFIKMQEKYGQNSIEPPPTTFPELPIDEGGRLRPLSPYATSKVYGDFLTRNYHMTYGLKTVVSRAFNHEGAGRGHEFVTSSIVKQIVSIDRDEQELMMIGDITAFRDWSHVEDIVDGYVLLAESGYPGAVYVQGSMHTNSVLTYILKTISSLGYEIQSVYSIADGDKKIQDPLAESATKLGHLTLKTNKIDEMILETDPLFDLKDEGLIIQTNKKRFRVIFDEKKYRPSDVPILMSNINKIKEMGFKVRRNLEDIINSQVNYYLDPENRKNVL